MRLCEVALTNFRGYRNETRIKIDPLTVLVGKNDSGKSSVLEALDIYFNDATIEHDDCCVFSQSNEIRIACVFDELPDSIVIDEQYATTLQREYLVRADGKLEIIKTYDCASPKGKCVGAFAVANHPSAAGVNDLLSLKITELRTKAQQLQVVLTNVNQSVKAQMRTAIWGSVQDLQLTEREISLKKEAAKDAFDQIERDMPTYALFKSDRASTDQDAEAQDPLKAAIKEAIKSREAALDGVLAEIRTELDRVAARTVEKIREMSPELANQLHPTVKNKNWDSLFSVALTGDDDIPINKRGSGTRRLILLNFFRAKAEELASGTGRDVIYAVEEPETSQHPNHQLMLLDAFEQLVEQGSCQVMLTTHTPTLARRVKQEYLRLITRRGGQTVIEDGANEATIPRIAKTLGVLRDHDVKVLVGVEGKHDINFLKHISSILSRIETDIPDLPAHETAGRLVFIPLGGSSLEVWASRLGGFHLPEFYLTDRDVPPPAPPKYNSRLLAWNERQGCTAWHTSKRELENYIHLSLLIAATPLYAGQGQDFDDVPLLFAQAIHVADPSSSPWDTLKPEVKKKKESNAKTRLNSEVVQHMTPVLLSQVDQAGELRGWLRTIGRALD